MAYELTAEQKKIADWTFEHQQGNSYESMRAACAAVLESATEPGAVLSDAEWKALCRDILDRRGLKWEWGKIDDCVKEEIRGAWSAILAKRRVLKDAPASQSAPAPKPSTWPVTPDGESAKRMYDASEPENMWTGPDRYLNWLKLMVDPDGGFYFDGPAKEAVRWAIDKIARKDEGRKKCYDPTVQCKAHGEFVCKRCRDNTEPPPAPAQTQGDEETVRAMIDAYAGPGRTYTPADEKRMLAALQVAREGYWSAEAVEEIVRSTTFLTSHGINDIIASLQRPSAPAAKTPEERVTVRALSSGAYFEVVLDGKVEFTFSETYQSKDAERYRLGLIAELAQLRKE